MIQADDCGEVVQKTCPRRERRAPSYFTPGSSSIAMALKLSDSQLPNPDTVADALAQEDLEDWKDAIEEKLDSIFYLENRQRTRRG